jgi:hypothetical protein
MSPVLPVELSCRLVLGSIRQHAREKQLARKALEQAHAVFDELGASLRAARAVDELSRIGGHRLVHPLGRTHDHRKELDAYLSGFHLDAPPMSPSASPSTPPSPSSPATLELGKPVLSHSLASGDRQERMPMRAALRGGQPMRERPAEHLDWAPSGLAVALLNR